MITRCRSCKTRAARIPETELCLHCMYSVDGKSLWALPSASPIPCFKCGQNVEQEFPPLKGICDPCWTKMIA